mgnify:CR=1
MILQALHQLYNRLSQDPSYGMPSPGRSIQKLSFRVVLYQDGRLFEIQEIPRTDHGPVQEEVLGSTKPAGPGINPCFLWDNTAYMLGYKPDDPKPDRTREAFEAFRERHLAAENEIDCPDFSAVCRFLESWSPESATAHPVLEEVASGFGVFQIVGKPRYVHHEPRVQEWWDENNSVEESTERGQCLITGETDVPIARLQPKIRGIPGGNPDKSLVGFKPDSFKSYGKDQAFNAPVSTQASREYAAALNAVLEGPKSSKHRFRLGDATVVFWTEKPTLVEDVFAQFASLGTTPLQDDNEDVQDESLRKKLSVFVEALRQGTGQSTEIAQDDPERTGFFLLGLSANAARLAVRFFHQSTIAAMLEQLRAHHRDCKIERQFGKTARKPDPEWPPLWLLLQQTAREARDIPSVLEGPLLQAVLTGTDYPQGLMTSVLRRITADRRISYARAFIIKGYLTRNLKQEVPMSLDPNRTDPAYRLGRLFAALERTQADALGQVNAPIRDRFYSSASATPRTVFPRLLRTYQHHLAKLEGGRKVNREKLIQEIMDSLDTFPAHLNLAEQGVFAIGYYHQTNAFFQPKENQAGNKQD